jgi:hypothetical protein
MPLFKNSRKTIYLFMDRRLEAVLVSERNNAGLKKLSQVVSEQTSDSSAFLNAMCLLKYVLNCEQHFSCFILRSGLIVTGLARVYSITKLRPRSGILVKLTVTQLVKKKKEPIFCGTWRPIIVFAIPCTCILTRARLIQSILSHPTGDSF